MNEVNDVLGRSSRQENLSDSGLLEAWNVGFRDDPANKHGDILHALFVEQFHKLRAQGIVCARQDRKADHVDVFLNCSAHYHFRRLAQSGIDDFHAGVAQRAGDHFRAAIMTVQAGVDVPDKTLRDRAEKLTPRLQDAYVQVLQLYAGGLVPGAPPDADYVARKLQEATDRVLGKTGGRFLIGGIMIN